MAEFLDSVTLELDLGVPQKVLRDIAAFDWAHVEVFEKPEFKEWATKNVVLMEVDFPRRVPLSPELQSQNGQLQQFFQVQGYPTIWLVNATLKDGKLNFEKLGQTGYVAGGPEAWLSSANQILSNK